MHHCSYVNFYYNHILLIMMNIVSPLSDQLSFCSSGDVSVLSKRTIWSPFFQALFWILVLFDGFPLTLPGLPGSTCNIERFQRGTPSSCSWHLYIEYVSKGLAIPASTWTTCFMMNKTLVLSNADLQWRANWFDYLTHHIQPYLDLLRASHVYSHWPWVSFNYSAVSP